MQSSHITLVKKYISDRSSVTLAELKQNLKEAMGLRRVATIVADHVHLSFCVDVEMACRNAFNACDRDIIATSAENEVFRAITLYRNTELLESLKESANDSRKVAYNRFITLVNQLDDAETYWAEESGK